MLVLARKAQESLLLGCSDGSGRCVKVTVLGISNGRVKLGFDGPDDIRIHRSEIREIFSSDDLTAHLSVGSLDASCEETVVM